MGIKFRACVRFWSLLSTLSSTYHSLGSQDQDYDRSPKESTDSSSDSAEEGLDLEYDEERLPSLLAPPTTPLFVGRTSYTLQTYHHVLDSLQIEAPARLVKQADTWQLMAVALLDSLQ